VPEVIGHRDPLIRADQAHQVVFKTRGGGFDMAALGSPRLESLQREEAFSDRVLGSFTESASVASLASAIRAVGG